MQVFRAGPMKGRRVEGQDERPRIALTMGDVAGVGPELIARGWGDPPLLALSRPFVVGNRLILQRALDLVGSVAKVRTITRPEDAEPGDATIPCLEASGEELSEVRPGFVDPRAGRAAYDFLIAATDLALAGRIDAITTLPLNKEALHAGGILHPGHTEVLAERCASGDAVWSQRAERAGWPDQNGAAPV